MSNDVEQLTVMLIEDQINTVRSVKSALSTDPTIEYLGYLRSRVGLAEFVLEHAPDVVLVDLELPVPSESKKSPQDSYSFDEGLKAISEIKQLSAQSCVIAFSVHFYSRPSLARASLMAGANAVLPKQIAPQDESERDWADWLKFNIKAVKHGYWRPDESLAKLIQSSMSEQSSQNLSEREQEVLRLLSRGMKDKEIAEKLVIAPATVRSHIRNIIGKLHAADRTNAIAIGRRNNSIPKEDNTYPSPDDNIIQTPPT